MSGLLQICSYIHFKLSRRQITAKTVTIIHKDRFAAVRSKAVLLQKQQKAVLTVETALVLPVFLFSVLALCYLFWVMEFQIKLQAALNQTAEQTASYGYLIDYVGTVAEGKAEELLEKTGLFSDTGLLSVDDTAEWVINVLESASAESVLKQMVFQCMEEEMVGGLRVSGSWEKVSFHASCLRDAERCVVLAAEYSIRIPFLPEGFSEMQMRQTAICRLHCGDRGFAAEDRAASGEEETQIEEAIYYITPNGSVYHFCRDCRYLKITVLHTNEAGIKEKRNNSGGKYYPCDRCTRGKAATETLYYTRGGSSYHFSKTCSGLTRTVKEVSKEAIIGMPPCSQCGLGE